MRAWLKANGGPPAVVVVGLGLLAWSRTAGSIVIAAGLLMWVASSTFFLRSAGRALRPHVLQPDEAALFDTEHQRRLAQKKAVILIRSELKDIDSRLTEALKTKTYRNPHDERNVFSTEKWNAYQEQLIHDEALLGAHDLADAAYHVIRHLNGIAIRLFPVEQARASRAVVSVEPRDEEIIQDAQGKAQLAIAELEKVQGGLS